MLTLKIPINQKPSGNIIDRIKTFEDACRELNIQPSELNVSGHLEKHFDSIAAYSKLIIIAEALNEGWTPTWSNNNETKYYPWFELSSGSGLSYGDFDYQRSDSLVGSRLCFKSKELAIYAGKQFTELYKQFFIIKTNFNETH